MAVHNPKNVSSRLESGVRFVYPPEPCVGTYDGEEVHVACIGIISTLRDLAQRSILDPAETIVRLLEQQERRQSLLGGLFSALTSVLNDVRGDFALVATSRDMLLAVSSPSHPLYWGSCSGATVVASAPWLFSHRGIRYKVPVPSGQVFCQTPKMEMFGTPRGPTYIHHPAVH